MCSLPELTELIESNFMNCTLCTHSFRDPVLLPCLHSACRDCLHLYMKGFRTDIAQGHNQGQEKTFPCPVCKTMCPLPSKSTGTKFLQDNYFLKSLAELKCCQNQKTKSCDYCKYVKKDVPATFRCIQCCDNMCASCTDAHHRTKLTRRHKVAPFDQIQLGKYDTDIRDNQHINCYDHPNASLSIFCVDCDQIICQECTMGNHVNHKLADVETTSRSFTNETSAVLQGIKAKTPKLIENIEFIEYYTQQMGETHKDTANKIQNHADELHTLIDEYKGTLLDQVATATNLELRNVHKQKVDLEDKLVTYKTTIAYLDKVLEKAKPEELLVFKAAITARQQELAFQPTDDVNSKLCLSFTPGNIKLEGIQLLFGSVSICEASLDHKSVEHNDEFHLQNTLGTSSAGTSTELLMQFECKGWSDAKDIWPTGVAVDSLGNIIIVDRENKCVKIFDKEGKMMNQFCNMLACPYDVAILSDNTLAVTDYDTEEVKIFTQTGDLVRSFNNNLKYPRGIATDPDGNLVVVDCHRRKLTIHDSTDGSVLKVIDGKGHDDLDLDLFTDPYYVTTTKDGFIIMTDWAAPSIKIFNKDGKYLSRYGTYGIMCDRVLQPYGICVDSFGYIFVADSQNHRIHLLAPNGMFLRFAVTKQHGLWHPMAIAIDNQGNLVVTEALGMVKIFRYL